MAIKSPVANSRETQSSPILCTFHDACAIAPATTKPEQPDAQPKRASKKKKKRKNKTANQKPAIEDGAGADDVSKHPDPKANLDAPLIVNSTGNDSNMAQKDTCGTDQPQQIDISVAVHSGTMTENGSGRHALTCPFFYTPTNNWSYYPAPENSNYLRHQNSAWGSDGSFLASTQNSTPPTTGSGHFGYSPDHMFFPGGSHHFYLGTTPESASPVPPPSGSQPDACQKQFSSQNGYHARFPYGPPYAPPFFGWPVYSPPVYHGQSDHMMPASQGYQTTRPYHHPNYGYQSHPNFYRQPINNPHCGCCPLKNEQYRDAEHAHFVPPDHGHFTPAESPAYTGEEEALGHDVPEVGDSAAAPAVVEETKLEPVPDQSHNSLTSEASESSSTSSEEAKEVTNQAENPSRESASPVATEQKYKPLLDVVGVKELEPLSVFLLGAFEREEFTDSRIVLTSSKNLFYPITFHVHKLIMARSPFLASLLKKNESPQRNSAINAVAGENFCLARAFEAALQTLYGLPLLDKDQLQRLTLAALGYAEGSVAMDPVANKEANVDFALCYAVSGAFLGNFDVVRTGIKLAIDLIDWDTAELCLHFGLSVADFAVTRSEVSPSECSTTLESDYHKIEGEDAASNCDDPLQELQQVWAPKVVTAVLEFIINSLPADFELYTKAQTTLMPDRIPRHLRNIPGSLFYNPKLETVKFGSLGSLNDRKPRRECCIASAVVLALPFEQLKEVFDIMEKKGIMIAKVVHEILAERETRRLCALRSYAKQNPSQKNKDEYPQEIKHLGFSEFVSCPRVRRTGDIDILVDFSLEKEWRGFSVSTSEIVDGRKLLRKKN
ncbi:hypothetical protein VTN00DRAFT_248 [Thermoascus crustaceus]|uniref:uncharacterized protein n=1 Tax=Thermoascus crustaceus TaxID=5088 RepID=UPI00374216DB